MKQQTIDTLKSLVFTITVCIAVLIIFVFSVGIQLFDSSVKNTIGALAWTVIFLILPILALSVPFIVKYKKNLSFKKTWLTAVISILLYSLISFGTIGMTRNYLKDFTSEKWAKHKDERYLMIDDLTTEYNLIGMPKDEVLKLLGESSGPYDPTVNEDLIDYRIGSFSIDPTMMTVVFENGIATEVYEYTEIRASKKSLY